MAFDLASAKPVGGFDLSSAKPVFDEPKQNMQGVPEPIGATTAPARKKDASSLLDKFIGGVENDAALLSSAWHGLAAPAYGVYKTLTSGKYGTPEGVKIGENAAARYLADRVFQPRTEKGQEYLDTTSAALSNLAPLAGLPGEVAGFGSGARYAFPAINEARQAATGKIAQVAREKIVDPEMARLARVAQERGIPIRPDQLSKSKLAKATGTFLERDVPLGGGKGEARSTAFTKAWIDEIGGDSSSGKATGDVFDAAKTSTGERIGEIYSATKLPDAAPLLQRGKQLVHEARYSEQAQRLVQTALEDLEAVIKDGAIDGAEFKKWNTSVLERLRDKSLGNTGELAKLQKAAFAEFQKHVPEELVPELNKLRYQYSLATRLEPAVAKAQNYAGELSPSDVNQAVFRGRDAKRYIARGKGGVPADLAAIGKTFVEEPGIKTSVAERYMLYRALGVLSPFGAGFLATGTPVGAAAVGGGVYGLANLYNRLGPKAAAALIKARETAPPSAPAGFNPTLGWGAYASPLAAEARGSGLLGDLTPDWTTSPGAGVAKAEGIEPAGLFAALGDERVGTTRLKGRPQMPAAEGLPGLADVAIAGKGGVWQYGKPWVDAEVKVGPEQSRLAAAPMSPGGIELSRLINMPKSAQRTKLLNDFKKRYPHAAEYIDQNM